MTQKAKSPDEIFEDEVRRIARELWPAAEFAGAVSINGRETDGVFITEDTINIIEATTSREKQKAIYDGEKLRDLYKSYSKGTHDKAVRCFFITKYEPTDEQRKSLGQIMPEIHALQYSQFQQRLINASEYLDCREHYAFGSARDPETDDILPKSGYIEIDILDATKNSAWGLENIKNSLLVGQRFCLLGDFGAGKSMTLREIYRRLTIAFRRNITESFPIYINLRDHQGQDDPSEVLLRHAKRIGFKHPDHLIRAWRAGYAVLMLDGFDEIGTIGWTGEWKKLKNLRFRAVEAVRKFVRETPSRVGVMCAGRAHFFDDDKERKSALGLNEKAVDLSLSDFSDEQVVSYLSKFGHNQLIPSWLPRRPLLIGYLASKGLIGEVIADAASSSDANDAPSGWDTLLDKISNREARIDTGIDGADVRRVIERIATKVRRTIDGLGPISEQQLSEAFFEICGYAPGEGAMVLLQRLPGLGTKAGAPETRVFIHEDLTDVCRVGDVLSFILDPFKYPRKPLEHISIPLGELGQQVLTSRSIKCGITAGKLGAALDSLNLQESMMGIMADLTVNAIYRDLPHDKQVFVKNVSINRLDLSEISNPLSNYLFQDCFISELELAADSESNYPKFISTYITRIVGRVSKADLPSGVFDDACIIEEFENSVSTSKEILALDFPLGQRVLLTILRKLYLQKGSGRRESALYRGLDPAARAIIPDILHAMKSDRLAYPARHVGYNVWYPVRNQTRRSLAMINAPGGCKDPVFIQVAKFSP